MTYDPNGKISVKDALNTERSYEYDPKFVDIKRTSKATKPSSDGGSVSSSWSYYDDGKILSHTEYPPATETKFDPYDRNLETGRTEAVGIPGVERKIATEWHSDFRVPTRITEPNRVTEFQYDAADADARRCGRVDDKILRLCDLTVTDTSDIGTGSRTWNFAYDDDGQIRQIDGPRTDVEDITTYQYDQGNLESVTNAAGHTTTFTDYDPHGRARKIEDPNGVITTLEYERGRLTSQKVGDELTKYEYDGVGQLIELRRPDGRSFVFTYDGAHRLTKVTDDQGNTIAYTLDLVGNPEREDVRDSAGDPTQTHGRTFDPLGRLESLQGVDDQKKSFQRTSFKYDDHDNLVGITDHTLNPSLTTLPWTYDALDRLETSFDLNKATTRYRYDANDRLDVLTDPLLLETLYDVDGLDNLINVDSPDTGLTTYSPDEAGNVESRTDARGAEGFATYSYDELNRVEKIEFRDGTVTFLYDEKTNDIGEDTEGIGRLTQMIDSQIDVTGTAPWGTTHWTYDEHGRVKRKAQRLRGVADPFVTQYSYDPTSGRLDAIKYPSGQVVRFAYTDGQVTEISVNGHTLLRDIQYEPFGFASKWVWGDDKETGYSREFDLEGRVKAYDLGGGRVTEILYDRSGRIKELVPLDPFGPHQLFDYDPAGRLIGFTINGATTILEPPDANGNRTRLTSSGQCPPAAPQCQKGTDVYTRDPDSNQLLSVVGPNVGPNPRTYVPDAAGNVLSDGVNQFAYDGRGRLKFATNKDGGTQFLINGLGQRVAKLDCPDPPRCERPPSSGRYFVHDEAGRLLGEYDHRGVPVQEFVYLDDMLVAVLMRDGRFFVYPDHLGTPRAISEAATGNVVWRWDHSDPFGATLPEEGRDQTGRLFTFNLRLPGQYFDQETGLFHNYFRDYDPQTGRYIQPDPIGLDGGINPYVYAEGNPLSYYDPYGLESWLDSLFLGALLPDLGGGIQDCPKGDLWCQIGFSLFEPNEAPPLFGPKFSGSRFGPKCSGSRALIPHSAHSSSSPRALIPHPVLSSSAPTRALVRQWWPPRGGALMGGQPWIINRGTLLSRIGELKGKYAAPLGTPFGARGLPLHYASKPDHRLLTLKPLSSLRGFSSPAFGQRGFGEQF